MAKKMAEPDTFLDEPDPLGIADDPDKAGLLSRIADLEKQLAAARTGPRINEPPPKFNDPSVTGYWRVKLQHAPTRIVEAVDRANAFDVWKQSLGVIGSEFPPTVEIATKEEFEFQESEKKAGRL